MSLYLSVDINGFIQHTHSITLLQDVQENSYGGRYAMIEAPPELIDNGCISSALYYFNGETVVPRPKIWPVDEVSLKADDIDTLRITNVPGGTTVILRTGSRRAGDLVENIVQIDDGVFEFSSAEVAIYEARFLFLYPELFRSQLIRINVHD